MGILKSFLFSFAIGGLSLTHMFEMTSQGKKPPYFNRAGRKLKKD